MSDALFSPFEVAADAHAGYRLQYLEVFNWGTFDGQVWRLRSGAETALLTGDIGSGKSTVVDAVTTLLLPAHRISYNRAAGATAKERDLRSYVEGHYKSERVEASGRSRPIGLRTGGKTYSVVLGVFVNAGYDEQVTLAQVFQQREATGQPYRFYVLAKRAMTIATDFADFGASLNDLRKRLRAADAQIFDEYPKYGTALRRALGIRSEQALELFHQTVSMKSVGNLNDFVRDHMLEPSDATDMSGTSSGTSRTSPRLTTPSSGPGAARGARTGGAHCGALRRCDRPAGSSGAGSGPRCACTWRSCARRCWRGAGRPRVPGQAVVGGPRRGGYREAAAGR